MSKPTPLDCPENDGMLLKAMEVFVRNYGSGPEVAVFAPGRVNLIGEHTDYNDGFVLPFALPFRTIVLASKIVDTCGYSCIDSNVVSCTIEESYLRPVSFRIDDTLQKSEPTWANYVKGTVYHYMKDLPLNFAFNAVIISNVPLGSGLSSSAALEVAIGTALEQLCGLTNVNGVEKALRCQKAEHTFCDTPCGIMDQFISSLGEKGKLLLIDCRYQTYNAIPFGNISDKNSPVVVVTNSLVKHQLSGSEYPDRVRQCKEAVAAIKNKYPAVTALRDCTMEMLDTVQKGPHAVSPTVYKRARHCITEDSRTNGAVAALERGEYAEVGRLMTASHNSLRDDYGKFVHSFSFIFPSFFLSFFLSLGVRCYQIFLPTPLHNLISPSYLSPTIRCEL